MKKNALTPTNHDFSELLRKLKITPRKYNYYEEAFTHTSYMNEHNLHYDYQRLEFLGDAIISKIVTCFLFHLSENGKHLNEGEMTKKKIAIVQKKTLARAAKSLKLDQYLRLGNGMIGSELPTTLYEDVFEAFMAAVYLDQGEKKVREILYKTIISYYLKNDLKDTNDYKTIFQEYMGTHSDAGAIEYRKVVSKASHQPHFCVELWCNGIKYGYGEGKKIKEAEVNAAFDALVKLPGFNQQED